MRNTVRVGIIKFNSNGNHFSLSFCKKSVPKEEKDIVKKDLTKTGTNNAEKHSDNK